MNKENKKEKKEKIEKQTEKELKQTKKENNKKNEKNEIKQKIKEERIKLIKPIFKKYDATSKEKAIIKEEVLAEIEDANAKKYFKYLKNVGIIKKYKGKYYYIENNENNKTNRKKTILTLGIIGIVILIIISIITTVLILNKKSKRIYDNDNVKFKISEKWQQAESTYNTEWNFYRYINTKPAIQENNTEETSLENYSNYPALISIYYSRIDNNQITGLNSIKESLEKSVENSDDKPSVFDMSESKTSKKYDLLKVKISFETEPEEILYYYYILKDEDIACITAYSFSLKDEKELEKQADTIANSFTWK